MKNKLTFLALLMFVITSLSFAQLNVGPGETYPTIQAAINAASPGDVINVAAGTYSESNIIVNKSVQIIGSGITTIINCGVTPPNTL